MFKHILVTLVSASLMMGLSGCTSKKATEESAENAEVAEASDAEMQGDMVEGDESAAVEGEASGDAAGDDAIAELGGDELSPDEQLPEDQAAEGEKAPAEEMAETPEQKSDDQVATAEPTPEPSAESTPEPTPEPMAEEPPPPIVEEPMAMGTTEEEAPKPLPSLRKIADAPWEQGGVWVNAVYLARKGDTLEGISQKIYGSTDRMKELKKINPTLKARDVKVGEKVYYSSPQRPTDNTRLLTYYEDIGLAPEVYVVNKPENIRAIAKNLLGEENSWKELWSTNLEVESKGELAEGTQLRYWALSPATTIAQTPPPVEVPAEPIPQPSEPAMPPPPDMTATPPPMETAPPPEVSAAPPPPPPPPEPELPPPPPPSMAQTAPPPPTPGGLESTNPLAEMGLDNPDQTMAMAAGAVLLFAVVALFIIVRKRRSRRQIDFHTATQTQIE